MRPEPASDVIRLEEGHSQYEQSVERLPFEMQQLQYHPSAGKKCRRQIFFKQNGIFRRVV